ncbi:MAG: hypothetical protein Q9174_001888 [Haloplaca sp. 1 TL-2023]
MHLRYLHLPGLTPLPYTARIQAYLVTLHLAHKRAPSSGHFPPPPTLLTFQTPPTYTTGRRDLNALTPSQIAHLRFAGRAEFHKALRGGQTTYHGPNQLTAYLVCDLRSHGLSSRAYVELLENAVISTLARFGVNGCRDAINPGVWTKGGEKIASVGVHLRRYVSSYGVGINVGKEVLPWFERIVMCGLVGKRATSIESELGEKGVCVEEVGRGFARSVAGVLECVEGKVEIVEEGDIIGKYLESSVKFSEETCVHTKTPKGSTNYAHHHKFEAS